MTKQVDFEKMGKKVPYRVPEGFFEDMQQHVLAQVQQPRRRRNALVWRISSAVVGIAAAVSALVFLPKSYPEPEPPARLTAGQALPGMWIEQLSDDDLQEMDDFSNYDIFMN